MDKEPTRDIRDWETDEGFSCYYNKYNWDTEESNVLCKEIRKDIYNIHVEYGSKYVTETMEKKDNIDCCVCLEHRWGVKLPNCDHYLCRKCYFIIFYEGPMIDYNEIENYNKPVKPPQPTPIKPPIYPYTKNELREIYSQLTDDIDNIEWFVNENKDLYICIMENEYVSEIKDSVKNWFVNDERMVKYNNDLDEWKQLFAKYKIEYNNYLESDEYKIYCEELEELERYIEDCKQESINPVCPLCRQ